MAVKEVPVSYIHTCDGCKCEETTKTKTRPKFWSELKLLQDAYDYQGCAVADGSISRSLCLNCTSKVTKAINASLV